jgi:hypothetical protein
MQQPGSEPRGGAAAAPPAFSPLALHALQLEGAHQPEEVSQQLLQSYAAGEEAADRSALGSPAPSAAGSSYEDARSELSPAASSAAAEAWPADLLAAALHPQRPPAPAGPRPASSAGVGTQRLLLLADEYNAALQEGGAAGAPGAAAGQQAGLDLEAVADLHIGRQQAAGQEPEGPDMVPAGEAAARAQEGEAAGAAAAAGEGQGLAARRPGATAATAGQPRRLLSLLLLQLLPGALRLVGSGLQATGLGPLLAPLLRGAGARLWQLLVLLARALAHAVSWMMWPLGLALSFWYARWALLLGWHLHAALAAARGALLQGLCRPSTAAASPSAPRRAPPAPPQEPGRQGAHGQAAAR